MTSTRQVVANRANARKATGPKTPAGKAVASRNATRHAILQGSLLASKGEDADALEALRDALASELTPAGPLEAALVERIVGALWRLRRVSAAEVGMFDIERGFETFATSDAEHTGQAFTSRRDTFAVLSRYEFALERSLFGALHELQRLQAARRAGADVPAPVAVDIELRGLTEGVG